MTDKEFMEHLREDITDLLDQLEMAESLEDLEPKLLNMISHKLWMINLEIDDVGGSIQ